MPTIYITILGVYDPRRDTTLCTLLFSNYKMILVLKSLSFQGNKSKSVLSWKPSSYIIICM